MLVISDSLKLKNNDPQVELKKGHIGYQNYVTRESLTASSSAAGFEVEGLANPLTFERWKPETIPAWAQADLGQAVDVDYIGLASHTIGSNNCVLVAEYSFDGLEWIEVQDVAPADNKSIMLIFPTVKARFWRIRITEGDAPPSIGVMYIGLVLTVQRSFYGGHTPVTMGRKTRRITNKTEGGQYAGVSIITEGIQTSVEWNHLDAVWYRQYFEPFVVAARSKPFFFAWRNLEFPAEVGYVWATEDIRPVNMGIKNLMQVSMNIEGYSDE